jgi:hypothetical protein
MQLTHHVCSGAISIFFRGQHNFVVTIVGGPGAYSEFGSLLGKIAFAALWRHLEKRC